MAAFSLIRGCFMTAASFFVFCGVMSPLQSYGRLFTGIQDDLNTTTIQTGWIGSVAWAMHYLVSPLALVSENYIGYRMTVVLGALVSSGSYLLSSYMTSFVGLLLTLGVLNGSAIGLCMHSAFCVLFKYFSAAGRTRASGVAMLGSSFGAVWLSVFYEIFIPLRGWRFALRMTAIFAGVLSIPGSFLIGFSNDLKEPETIEMQKDLKKHEGVSGGVSSPESQKESKTSILAGRLYNRLPTRNKDEGETESRSKEEEGEDAKPTRASKPFAPMSFAAGFIGLSSPSDQKATRDESSLKQEEQGTQDEIKGSNEGEPDSVTQTSSVGRLGLRSKFRRKFPTKSNTDEIKQSKSTESDSAVAGETGSTKNDKDEIIPDETVPPSTETTSAEIFKRFIPIKKSAKTKDEEGDDMDYEEVKAISESKDDDPAQPNPTYQSTGLSRLRKKLLSKTAESKNKEVDDPEYDAVEAISESKNNDEGRLACHPAELNPTHRETGLGRLRKKLLFKSAESKNKGVDDPEYDEVEAISESKDNDEGRLACHPAELNPTHRATGLGRLRKKLLFKSAESKNKEVDDPEYDEVEAISESKDNDERKLAHHPAEPNPTYRATGLGRLRKKLLYKTESVPAESATSTGNLQKMQAPLKGTERGSSESENSPMTAGDEADIQQKEESRIGGFRTRFFGGKTGQQNDDTTSENFRNKEDDNLEGAGGAKTSEEKVPKDTASPTRVDPLESEENPDDDSTTAQPHESRGTGHCRRLCGFWFGIFSDTRAWLIFFAILFPAMSWSVFWINSISYFKSISIPEESILVYVIVATISDLFGRMSLTLLVTCLSVKESSLLLASNLIIMVVTLAFLLIPVNPVLIVCSFFIGIGRGWYDILPYKAGLDLMEMVDSDRGLTLVMMSLGLGFSLGTLPAGAIFDATGSYKYAFYINSSLYLIGGSIQSFLQMSRCIKRKGGEVEDSNDEDELEGIEREDGPVDRIEDIDV